MKEAKHINLTSITSTPILGTSIVESLNLVGVGDTDITRDGDDIYVMSIQVKGIWTAPTTAVTDSLVRVLLVKKIDVRGTILSVTELFDGDNFTSMRLIDNSKNFKVLKVFNMRLPIAPTPIADDAISQKVMNFYYKFKNPLRCKYSGDTAGLGDLDRNGLFFIIQTNNVAASVAGWLHTTRITFKDV